MRVCNKTTLLFVLVTVLVSSTAFASGDNPKNVSQGSSRPAPVKTNIPIKAYWSCDQTTVPGTTRPLPSFSETAIEITIDYDSTRSVPFQTNLEDFNAFLSRADSSDTDYFECATTMANSFAAVFRQECVSRRITITPCDSISQSMLFGRLMRIARNHQKPNGLPTVLPMEDPENLDEYAIDYLKNNIRNNCSTGYLYKTAALSQKFIIEHLSGITRNLPIECKRKILESYSKLLKTISFPPGCASRSDTPVCKRVENSLVALLNGLEPIRRDVYGDNPESISFTEATICLRESNDKYEIIDSLFSNVRDIESCVKLRSGEERVVDTYPIEGGQYKLRRNGAGSYEAVIGLNLMPVDLSGSAEDIDNQVRNFRQKYTNCLNEAAPMLRGPGGERLSIRIAGETEVTGVRPYSVTLRQAIPRANMLLLGLDVQCSTILHETMHMLGLVDEYEETWSGYCLDPSNPDSVPVRVDSGAMFSEYDCRVMGPEYSIMSNHINAYRRVFGAPSTLSTLLLPAHFRGIIFSGCSRENRLYYSCARNSQRTSSSHYGGGCLLVSSQCPSGTGSDSWLH